jgi:hypothetical protein
MPINRAAWRNVYLYDVSTGEMLGGTHQNGSMTEANLLAVLDQILLVVEDHWTLKHRPSGQIVGRTDKPIQLGAYDIYSSGNIPLLDMNCGY